MESRIVNFIVTNRFSFKQDQASVLCMCNVVNCIFLIIVTSYTIADKKTKNYKKKPSKMTNISKIDSNFSRVFLSISSLFSSFV